MNRYDPKQGAAGRSKIEELTLVDDYRDDLLHAGARGRPRTPALDPYNREPAGQRAGAKGTRTDLRKLSEWIKLKRDVEALKSSGA